MHVPVDGAFEGVDAQHLRFGAGEKGKRLESKDCVAANPSPGMAAGMGPPGAVDRHAGLEVEIVEAVKICRGLVEIGHQADIAVAQLVAAHQERQHVGAVARVLGLVEAARGAKRLAGLGVGVAPLSSVIPARRRDPGFQPAHRWKGKGRQARTQPFQPGKPHFPDTPMNQEIHN